MKTDYKYIRFAEAKAELTPEFAEKHKVWIITAWDGLLIGSVTYYGPWRQYCLLPQPDTVWSAGCLADVQDFITQLEE